jgi:hypothetical protein
MLDIFFGSLETQKPDASEPASVDVGLGKTGAESKEKHRPIAGRNPVNHRLALTKTASRTSFAWFPWSFEPAGLQPR